MKSLLYSNNVIKSDYVKIKGKVSLNHFASDDKSNDKQEIPDSEEIYNNEEKKLELLKLEEEINQKLIDAQAKYDEILNLANIESEKILAESRDNAVDIEKKAYHEGYEQGIKNGYEDGYKEAGPGPQICASRQYTRFPQRAGFSLPSGTKEAYNRSSRSKRS